MNRFFTLLFAGSCLTAVGQVPDYVPTDGLVAWYPFNGNAQDESGNGHHAAIDGATLTDDRYGNFDAAFYFDGSDRIIAPQNVSPEGNSARTINAFFKSYTGLPVGNNQYSLQAIFGSGSGAGGKVIYSLNIDGIGTNQGHIPRTGHLYFSSGSWQDEAWSQESVSASLWHMATMTYEGPNTPVRVYLDGQFQDETDPITLNTHLSDFYIGDVPWTVLFFNGLIDDLGVWNRALTDEEILALLGPEVSSGCTDTDACNFANDANLDDGSCHFNCLFCQDGTVWDEEVQGCISANTADINNDGCVQLNDLLDLLSAYGDCGAEESPWLCGDPLEYQGYDYETVLIGDQCWFAENLRSENYENGDAIASNLSDSEWENTSSGAVAVYGEDAGCQHYYDIDACDPAQSLNEYGRLYNWYAVDDARGLCPSSWHVPTDWEWMIIEMALGMSEAEVNDFGWRGTDQGAQMKMSNSWYSSGHGSNSSGFSGLPAGFRGINGYFFDAGTWGYWWSSSPEGSSAWYRGLYYNDEEVQRSNLKGPRSGFPVRCVRDVE